MKIYGVRFKQAGISLLEVLLSLAIIAIILVMAMQYFSTASNNQKLNIVRTFIGADMAAIQGYGVNNNGFTGMTWGTLVKNGYLSTDTKSLSCDSAGTNCKQITPWGDEVTLSVSSSLVTLSFDLPEAALCNNLKQSYGENTVSCEDETATVYVNGKPAVTPTER